MDPEKVQAWQRIGRDVVCAVTGVFMLVHQTLSTTPNALIIGAALSLLAVPGALRIDERRRKASDEDKG